VGVPFWDGVRTLSSGGLGNNQALTKAVAAAPDDLPANFNRPVSSARQLVRPRRTSETTCAFGNLHKRLLSWKE
jgi:hypothetical protein